MPAERAQERALPDIDVTDVHPEGAVHLGPGHQQGAAIAQVLLPAGAPTALAAPGDERGHDVVADLKAAHARPDLEDDPGPLVATAIGKVAQLYVAAGQVVVGVAEPAGGELDEHLVVLRSDRDRPRRPPTSRLLEEHGGLGLHRSPPCVTRPCQHSNGACEPSGRERGSEGLHQTGTVGRQVPDHQ